MSDEKDEKVVDFLSKRDKKAKEDIDETEVENHGFEEIMKLNKEKKKREAEERAKSNRSVTRSYRLKH